MLRSRLQLTALQPTTPTKARPQASPSPAKSSHVRPLPPVSPQKHVQIAVPAPPAPPTNKPLPPIAHIQEDLESFLRIHLTAMYFLFT